MAKDTVEDSKALDVCKLSREGWLTPGKVCVMTWSRGDVVTGSTCFIAMDGCLRFRYTQTSRWTDERQDYDYIVRLERTPARFGGERVWFACPRCCKRVQKLYLPPGGGRFACRRCHDLAYDTQHQSRTHRAMDRFFRLADRLSEPSTSLRQFIARSDAYDAAYTAAMGSLERSSRRFERQARQPRGRGRPSKRELRERARLEREASRPPAPETPRPRGRPKIKRDYVRRQPARKLTPIQTERQAYCVRCGDRRSLKWARPTTLANGRSAIRGRCSECRTRILRLTRTSEYQP